MIDRIFVDTNVLVYSRDASEPSKQKKAIAWIAHLWREKNGCVSFQVLNEFYITVTKKLQPGIDQKNAREDIRSLLAWHPIPVDDRVIYGAWHIQDRYKLSWWDALIVSAAQVSKCRYLLTEDLQENLNMGGIEIINPFNTRPESL